MKSRRPRITAFFFCAILLLPILAIGLLQAGQAWLKLSREERLETEKLVHLVLPAKDITWEEEGKELWVGDEMFDVASFFTKDGLCYLTGVYDKEETAVAGTLFHAMLSNEGSRFLQLLFLLQCFSVCLLFLSLVLPVCKLQKQVGLYLFQLSLPYVLILTPPPQNRVFFQAPYCSH